MELLLNLAWLLLAVPAYYLWRDSRCVYQRRRFSSAQCILALGCMLVVLFPVVSATDDLHVMRAELEESPASKRSLRQASSERPSTGLWHSQGSMLLTSQPIFVSAEIWLQIPNSSSSLSTFPLVQGAGRAPPSSVLS